MSRLRDEIQLSVFDRWHHLVRSSVRTRTPEDAEEIAWRCAEAEHRGDRFTCTWHEAAAYYGTKCHCRSCNP